MSNLYSIIIPLHNKENTIERAVLSVLNNKVNCEILIIENNSTDKSLNKCLELKNKYKEVKLFQTYEKGVSNARNIGLDNTSGNIITFLDADDYFEDDYLEKIDKLFNESNYDIISSSLKEIRNNNITTQRSLNKVIDGNKFINELCKDYYVRGYACSKFYKKEIINSVRFNKDLKICEDNYFNLEIASNNRNIKVRLSDINGYIYIFDDNNSTRSIDNIYRNNEYECIRALELAINKLNLDNYEISLLKRLICNFAQNAYRLNLYNNDIQKKYLKNKVKETRKYYLLHIFTNSLFGNIYRMVDYIRK